MMDEDALLYKGLAAALGLITLAKMNDFLKHPPQIITKAAEAKNSVSLMKEGDVKFKCPVCYDYLEDASFASINCGHVYCWHCISRWIGAASELTCPVCRLACEPTDLIPLANLK